jgi:hypothetical protein
MTRAESARALQRVRRGEIMKRRATLKGSHDRHCGDETPSPKPSYARGFGIDHPERGPFPPCWSGAMACNLVRARRQHRAASPRRRRSAGAPPSVARSSPLRALHRARALRRARGRPSKVVILRHFQSGSGIWSNDRSGRSGTLLSESWTRSEQDVSVNESDGSRGTICGARDAQGSCDAS